jgi:adenylate kinase family enzyme
MAESNCPLPTQDIKTNLANRQKAIDVAQYGPANPKEPNEAYWTEKAKTFGGSVEEAKTMRCGNCAGFNKTKKLMDCISKGIGADAQEVEQAGDLGYCEIFDFKCASMRTCSAWIVGGPITDNANLELQKYTKPKLRERIKNRILRGTSGGKAGQWSARKAQLLVQAYEKAGGGYKGGRSKSQASLKKWGKEKWTTSDGKPSLRKGKDKRYLPQRVWDKLTPAQKAGANRTKAEGSKKGKQFVPNTPTVKKAFSYNGKTFELSDSATLLYDPSQTRDESGRWSGSSGESNAKISGHDSEVRQQAVDGKMEDRRLKDSPDKNYILKHNKIPTDSEKVTIYRASPSDIREGDFAALNKEHASSHIRSAVDKIFTKVVDIADLIQGWDANEVIYAPKKEKKSRFSSDATNFYDPSQKRDESGKWTSEGFVSSVESPKEISNRIISRIQKENPDIDIEDGKFKKSIESLGENLKDAKIKTKYGNFTPKQISNWIKSEDGQKLIGAVDKTLKVTGAGAIGALKGLDEAKFDIATNAIFAPQVIPFIATRSAIQGIFNNAVREYRSIKKGQEIKSAVEKQVGVKPLGATMKSVELQEEMNVSDVAEYLTDVLRVSILKYIKNKKDFQVITFYDPNQERDASGKWTGSGGGGEILVSPNIKENMNYEEAKKMTDSPEHARAVSIARDAIKKQDMDGKVESGVGDWEDGAENSIKIDVKGVKDFDQLKYTASKLGASLNQKAVVAFQKKKDGPDILHKISADRPMDEVRKILSENGISFRTMVGDRAKTSVTILDQGSQLTANVAKFLGAINGKSEAVRGVGEFIGGDTRIAGKKAYKSIIDNYERSFPNRVRLGVQRRGGRNYYRSYQAIDLYDPSQKRDESGKWTGGGGSIAKGSTPTPRWAQDNPAEASKKTGEATTLYHGTSADVLKDIRKDGLKPSSSGVWGGGKVYSTDSLDLAMEYGVLRSGKSPKVGGKQLIGIISVLAEGFKSVADNIPTTKAQKMGKTGLAAVSKIFTKDGVVPPSAIKMMQIFEVDSIRKYVYENGPKPSPLATKELAEGQKLIYVPIVIEVPDDGSEGFQFDEAVAIESFVFQYNGEKIEFYNPSQPRDENGRWSGKGGGGGKGKAKGKSSKSKKQSEASTENTESDEIEKEIQRLNAEPKTKITIEKMAKLQKEVAKAEGSENAPVTHWSLRDPKRYIQKKDLIETFESPTAEHKAWKDSVIESELNPKAVSKNPIAVILMGSPASGKTTTGRPFAERILNGKETTKIDPDSVKGKSKGFEGWNAGAFHEESALISEKVVFPRAVVNNHNLLIDITGKNSNKVAEMARTLKSVGYTIGLVHVDVDDKVALNRASQRFNKPNGRYVPYNYIKGSAQQARNTWNKLTSEGIADIGYSLDGNADRSKGTAPVKATHGNLFD